MVEALLERLVVLHSHLEHGVQHNAVCFLEHVSVLLGLHLRLQEVKHSNEDILLLVARHAQRLAEVNQLLRREGFEVFAEAFDKNVDDMTATVGISVDTEEVQEQLRLFSELP